MNIKIIDKTYRTQLNELFHTAFAASDGDKEGELVGNLASELAQKIDNNHIIGVGYFRENDLLGAIFFTRLYFKEPVDVYMLAPVVVGTQYQGNGVGTSLIEWGLTHIRGKHTSFVVTYGDPAYYSRFGFKSLSEKVIKAPLKLSLPHGWQGLAMSTPEIPVLKSKPKCVAGFNHPELW